MAQLPISPKNPPTNNQLGWTGWLLIGTVLTLIISIILRILTPPVAPTLTQEATPPQTPFSKQNMDGSVSEFSNIVYEGPEFRIPEKLAIIAADTSDKAASSLAEKLIKLHQLSPQPDFSNVWVGKNFIFSKNTNNHEYILTGTNNVVVKKEIDLKTIEAAATKLLAGYPELTNLSLVTANTKYLNLGEVHSSETVAELANGISLDYAWKINDIPVYLPKRFEGGFVVVYSADLIPLSISFPMTIPSFGEEISTNQTLSIAEAIGQLNQSVGSVIYAEQVDAKVFDVSTISSGKLTSVSLEYRIDPDLKLAIPHYRFKGTITNSTGSVYTAQLLTPAVATTPAK